MPYGPLDVLLFNRHAGVREQLTEKKMLLEEGKGMRAEDATTAVCADDCVMYEEEAGILSPKFEIAKSGFMCNGAHQPAGMLAKWQH